MAITGLIMVGFLLFHMYGNMKIFLGGSAFDDYSHYLRDFLHPVLMHGHFLWAFRIFMLVAIALHIWSAVTLWQRNKSNVGAKRYAKGDFFKSGYVPFLMRWGGVMILLFLIFHILSFTTQTVRVNYPDGRTDILPSERFINGFSEWWLVALYALAMFFVCMHVWRGFWSAFATLGANVSLKAEKTLNVLAGLIALLLFIGFMAAPVAVALGMIGQGQ